MHSTLFIILIAGAQHNALLFTFYNIYIYIYIYIYYLSIYILYIYCSSLIFAAILFIFILSVNRHFSVWFVSNSLWLIMFIVFACYKYINSLYCYKLYTKLLTWYFMKILINNNKHIYNVYIYNCLNIFIINKHILHLYKWCGCVLCVCVW